MFVLPCIFISFSVAKLPDYIKNYKYAKDNYVKVEVTVTDYQAKYLRRWVSYKKRPRYSYSAICSYIDDLGNEYLLKTDRYTLNIPVKGTVKEVYIDPSNPDIYYDELSSENIDVMLIAALAIISVSYSYITLKDLLSLRQNKKTAS